MFRIAFSTRRPRAGRATLFGLVILLVPACSGDGGTSPWVSAPVPPVPVDSVHFGLSSPMRVGWSHYLDATVVDENGDRSSYWKVTYKSDDERVARIWEEMGWGGFYLTAAAEGEATITAEAGRVSAATKVTILPALLDVSPAEVTIELGATAEVGASVLDQLGAAISSLWLERAGVAVAIEWMSDDPDVATVDAEGRVTGVAPGTARVFAGPSGPLGPHFRAEASAVVTVQ